MTCKSDIGTYKYKIIHFPHWSVLLCCKMTEMPKGTGRVGSLAIKKRVGYRIAYGRSTPYGIESDQQERPTVVHVTSHHNIFRVPLFFGQRLGFDLLLLCTHRPLSPPQDYQDSVTNVLFFLKLPSMFPQITPLQPTHVNHAFPLFLFLLLNFESTSQVERKKLNYFIFLL